MKRYIFALLILSVVVVFPSAQTANDGSFRQEGIASWYGKEFEGRPTANGEIFDPSQFTAAHPTLPFGTILTITNKQNMKQVTIRVNDRGPFVAARIIDLSMAAAEALDMITTGTAPVIVEKALNTALGPVLPVSENASSTVITTATTSSDSTEELMKQKPTTAPSTTQQTTQLEIVNVPPDSPLVEEFYNAPAAKIVGGIPPTTSSKSYRLQVGAFTVPRNALNAFEKLKNAGLNPAYEQNGEFYRVVLAGLKASEIQAIAQILANNGFPEAIIREEIN